MPGSLALARGILFVGVHAKTAHVRVFDLGGRELRPSFSFRDPLVGCSAASGLAVDDDRTLLVADTPADRVRRFSLFGRELQGISAPDVATGPAALPGLISRPVDIEVQGHRDHGWIAIACAAESRHAVQIFEPELVYRASLVSLGEPGRAFRGVCRLASVGAMLFVAEALARCVQVFRAGEFLFAFSLRDARGERFEPSAIAPLADGRVVLACRAPHSALFLLDGGGRPLRQLAGHGEAEGSVFEPSDAVLEPGAGDRHARLCVIDRDGLRVQAFTLEGRCLGAFSLAGALSGSDRPSTRARPKGRGKRENEGGR